MADQKCKFCEALEMYRRIDAVVKDFDPNMSNRYSVAIARRAFIKGRKGCQSIQTDYGYRKCGYKLNFCPECGRDLNQKG